MYVRIVEVEASLDAKSDDTLDVCETEKRYSLVVVSPRNKGLFWDAESHDGKKKEKTVGSKSPKKFVCWKRILSPVIRFLVCAENGFREEQKEGWCTNFEGDGVKINAHILSSH